MTNFFRRLVCSMAILFTLTRNPLPMVAGEPFSTIWRTTDATSVAFNCTANGTGLKGSGPLATVNGTDSGTASPLWVGYPTTCVWTVTGPGGTITKNEVLNTINPAPTFTLIRNPLPMVAGKPFSTVWRTTDATSVAFNCTANGTGLKGSGPLATVNGTDSGTANPLWVGYPTTCVWTVTGPGGTITKTEVLNTVR